MKRNTATILSVLCASLLAGCASSYRLGTTLDPSLLGPEFKREADNAMLRRKGVEE